MRMLLAVAAITTSGLWWVTRAWEPVDVPPPAAVADYEEAVARIEAQRRSEGECLPECQSRLLTHGRRTEKVALLFHGFTNCPAQFLRLGEEFHRMSWNVYIPRAPHHGKKNRLTDEELGELTAGELAAFAAAATDTAQGLGSRVVVTGLSMGGLLAAWTAQTRGDVERAVAIAPALSFSAVPEPVEPLLLRVVGRSPNFFLPWDPRKPLGHAEGPPHASPRLSSHGLASMIQLAGQLNWLAQREKPRTPSIRILTNPNDHSVRNSAASRLVAAWRKHGTSGVETYEFPAEPPLIHDLIDPLQPRQRIDRVYPVIVSAAAHPEIRALPPAAP
jgi:pimeloyl-ACP methyl ester carboxylesterase